MSPASPKPQVALNLCPMCRAAIDAVVPPSVVMPCPQCGHRVSVWPLPDGLQVFGERSAERVIAMAADKLVLSPDKITPTDGLNELGADSLDVVEILMEIEHELDITIATEEQETVRTVGDVIRVVDSCLSAKKE
jgi:acyl carrier protein